MHLLLLPTDDSFSPSSLWSEASGSAANSTIQARELMLQRAYGSQLDLSECQQLSVKTLVSDIAFASMP